MPACKFGRLVSATIAHLGVSQMNVSVFTLLAAVALAGCSSPAHGRRSSLQPYLPGIQEFLQGYVDAEATNQLNFFYVAPVHKNHGRAYAYAYWMTGNSILILDLPIGKMEDYFWYWYKARVDLATDLVPTGEDIAGSTYLVDAPWAENIIRDSLQSGMKFIIQKKEANPQGRANGRQPVESETNRTSAAAASRRSP